MLPILPDVSIDDLERYQRSAHAERGLQTPRECSIPQTKRPRDAAVDGNIQSVRNDIQAQVDRKNARSQRHLSAVALSADSCERRPQVEQPGFPQRIDPSKIRKPRERPSRTIASPQEQRRSNLHTQSELQAPVILAALEQALQPQRKGRLRTLAQVYE